MFLLPLILFILPCVVNAYIYPYECSNACPSGCNSWYLTYEVDCNCNITAFESWHFYYGIGPFGLIIENNTHYTAPGWVGMNAAALGCDCDYCI